MCVSVCLPDPVSCSLVQSVMSMASSHSQHSHISTDTMSSMSGSYLAGVEGEHGAGDGGDGEGDEENQDTLMESRGPSQQDGVRSPRNESQDCRRDSDVCYKCAGSSLDCLHFCPSGIFPGAKGTQLFSGDRGAGLRGDCNTVSVCFSITQMFFNVLQSMFFLFLQGNDVTEEDCSSPSNGKGSYGDHPSPFNPDFCLFCSQAM